MMPDLLEHESSPPPEDVWILSEHRHKASPDLMGLYDLGNIFIFTIFSQ